MYIDLTLGNTRVLILYRLHLNIKPYILYISILWQYFSKDHCGKLAVFENFKGTKVMIITVSVRVKSELYIDHVDRCVCHRAATRDTTHTYP